MKAIFALLLIFLVGCQVSHTAEHAHSAEHCMQLPDGSWEGDCDIEHMQEHMNEMHKHGSIEWPAELPAPEVVLEVSEDSMSGWNVHITAQGFSWSPENVGGENVPGEGHAHLYVDGHKVARLYGDWFHLTGLEEGEHTVIVTLNANDHSTYTREGEDIFASQIILVE